MFITGCQVSNTHNNWWRWKLLWGGTNLLILNARCLLYLVTIGSSQYINEKWLLWLGKTTMISYNISFTSRSMMIVLSWRYLDILFIRAKLKIDWGSHKRNVKQLKLEVNTRTLIIQDRWAFTIVKVCCVVLACLPSIYSMPISNTILLANWEAKLVMTWILYMYNAYVCNACDYITPVDIATEQVRRCPCSTIVDGYRQITHDLLDVLKYERHSSYRDRAHFIDVFVAVNSFAYMCYDILNTQLTVCQLINCYPWTLQ